MVNSLLVQLGFDRQVLLADPDMAMILVVVVTVWSQLGWHAELYIANPQTIDETLPNSCNYLRATGIWQSVWMEPVPEFALRRPRLTPDVANGMIRIEQPISNNAPGLRFQATLLDEWGVVTSAESATRVRGNRGIRASSDRDAMMSTCEQR